MKNKIKQKLTSLRYIIREIKKGRCYEKNKIEETIEEEARRKKRPRRKHRDYLLSCHVWVE